MPKTFTVEARGVGRKDYSEMVEHATQPFITPSLRQGRFSFSGATFILPVLLPFPRARSVASAMPQEDGTFGWFASSIVVHFQEVHVSLRTHSLVTVGLVNYDSIADYFAGIIAERSPQIFSYGKADLNFIKGMPTQKGKIYAVLFGGWPDTATMEITITFTGIMTELTTPWME